jgi:signal transduction histidine kinase
MKGRAFKISTFLLISQFIICTIGVGSVTGFALYSIYRAGRQELLREMENLAYAIGNGLEIPLAENYPYLQQIATSDQAQLANIAQTYLVNHPYIQYGIYQSDGRLLDTSTPALFSDLPPDGRPAEINAALALTHGSDVRLDTDGEMKVYSAATIDHGAEIFGMIQIEQPYWPAMARTTSLMTTIGLLAAVIVSLMMLASWQASRYLSEPVLHLNDLAEKLSQSDLTARASLRGPREIIHLASTLNTMADHLQTSLEGMQSFVANASHELRTPLTSIKLQVGALLGGAVEEPEIAQRFLKQMDCEIDRLVYTVNEMLDLSQIESGVHAGKVEAVDILDLACEVQALWEVRSLQAKLSLTLQNDPHLPNVKGDAFRLRRLFDNLVDNAIKNTPSGGQVQIILRRSANPGRLRIEIHDTGTGIEAQHLPHIFERFYRVNPSKGELPCPDGANIRRSSGSGLGLAIARSIVLAHHGEIGVESSHGSGSTFWVELPIWTE